MTREEKELIVKVIASATDKVPTKTFAELTKYFFEPRSCESCKWYDGYECEHNDCPASYIDKDVFPDFYCKYYERKEDDATK